MYGPNQDNPFEFNYFFYSLYNPFCYYDKFYEYYYATFVFFGSIMLPNEHQILLYDINNTLNSLRQFVSPIIDGPVQRHHGPHLSTKMGPKPLKARFGVFFAFSSSFSFFHSFFSLFSHFFLGCNQWPYSLIIPISCTHSVRVCLVVVISRKS